jgi:hypothetical protein
MKVKGTPHSDGGYTVTATGPKWARKIFLALMVAGGNRHRVLSRTDRYVRFGPAEEVLVEQLPMYLNLGDLHNWDSQIGWAKVVRDFEGRHRIEITLDKEASAKLGNMVDVFDLKAIGFAGIKHPS